LKKNILLLFIYCFSSASAQKSNDLQLWNTNALAVHLFKGISMEVAEKIQYSTSDRNLFLKQGDLWLKHELNRWFEYGAGFRLVSRKHDIIWKEEQRLMVLMNISNTLGGIGMTLSNRLEHRSIEDSGNHFRYREMLSIHSPTIPFLNTSFYVSEEAFYRMDTDQFHLLRFYGGIESLMSKHSELKLFYAIENIRQKDYWKQGTVLGMNLKFKI
jgi:hypothetical protein